MPIRSGIHRIAFSIYYIKVLIADIIVVLSDLHRGGADRRCAIHGAVRWGSTTMGADDFAVVITCM